MSRLDRWLEDSARGLARGLARAAGRRSSLRLLATLRHRRFSMRLLRRERNLLPARNLLEPGYLGRDLSQPRR